MGQIGQGEERASRAGGLEAARKRAVVETYARHEAALRRTARRYSLCADDADDALQRALEILLMKAPSDDHRELVRWTQTVVKHEALAIRRERERILGGAGAVAPESGEDWVTLIPAGGEGPAERVERRETIARSREAMRALKPQERRALSLLAEGYTYAEIGEITGFSHTKVNRCLAEGRERFRNLLSRSADGRRCAEMEPSLSAFCDGEAGAEEAAAVREHLRACASCRATLRAYRAAPRAVAALAPVLSLGRSPLDRLHEWATGLVARFGSGSESAVAQVAGGGTARGAGMAGLAKLLAICAGTAGGAAACVATGTLPVPIEAGHAPAKAPRIQGTLEPAVRDEWSGVDYEPAPEPAPQPRPPAAKPAGSEPPESEATGSSGGVEYAAEPTSEPEPAIEAPSPSAQPGSPAGEFGP